MQTRSTFAGRCLTDTTAAVDWMMESDGIFVFLDDDHLVQVYKFHAHGYSGVLHRLLIETP